MYKLRFTSNPYVLDNTVHLDHGGGGKSIIIPAQVININRLAGVDRYGTAVAVSRSGWEKANIVVLSRGDEYADALAESR